MTSMERHAQATRAARAYLAEQHVECLAHAPVTASTWWRCRLATRHPDGSDLIVTATGVSEDASLALAWENLRIACLRHYLAAGFQPDRLETSTAMSTDLSTYEPGPVGVAAVNRALEQLGEIPAGREEVFDAARGLLLRGSSAPPPTVLDVVNVIRTGRDGEQLRLGA
jgi:hypothetical protein